MPFLASVPFDQYQRYGVAVRAIEAVRQHGTSLRILEVGSNIHQLLGRLLPNDIIDYLDLEIPEHMRGQANIIVGDATALALADKSYDIVLSLDVFEHIPQELRSAFLMHTNRVAKLLTIVGAPFDSPATAVAEQNALDFWNQLFDTPYRWLVEHAENGLPNLEFTVKKVKELGYHAYSIDHGDLELWTVFIKAHFAEVCVDTLQPVLSTLYDYYQSHIFEKDFFPAQSYRKFIFSSADLECIKTIEAHFEHIRAINSDDAGQKMTIGLLKLLPAIALEKMHDREEIVNRGEIIATLNGHISTLKDHVASLHHEVGSLKTSLDYHVGALDSIHQTLAARDRQIADLYNSSSWRVTSPIRFAVRQLKRVPRAVQLALPAVKISGGLGNALRKAAGLYMREGMPGIKRGFRLAAMSVAPVIEPVTHAPPNVDAGNKDYTEWVRQFDTLTELDRVNMRATQADFVSQPILSVLMPTYNPRPEWLIEAIESVRSQIYTHWELCIADDASSDPAIRTILERYASQDSRIKIIIRPKNGHISLASNSALELATGQWVALLDHDDTLSEHALFWVAHCINVHPDARMIYSDEDKTDKTGNRLDPYFKSDWNPDLFYSHNLFCHLGVYEVALVRQVGGFRQGFEGAQDYDLALRCIEQVQSSQIHHIPRVLYQWRVHAESTALSADTKPYAMIAGERAINEHFARTGVKGSAKLTGHGYQVSYELPTILPLVSIIIPTRNGLNLLKQCIDSLLAKTTYPNFEILIIDNGSDDTATLSYLIDLAASPKNGKNISIIRDDSPFNYSQLNNRAVAQAKGEVVALLNNDIEVITPNWLSEMVSHALRAGVGAVGAKLWYPDDTLQHGGVVLGIGGVAAHVFPKFTRDSLGYFNRAVLIQNYSAVTAACLVVRKSIYLQVGGLNETDLAVAFNDVDFCIRIREAGYRNIWTPVAELYHHESATRGYEDTVEKQARFMAEVNYMKKTWGELLNNDPAYSLNLSLTACDYSYAWPPRMQPLPLHPSLVENGIHAQPSDRVTKTMHMLKKDGLGLEIGPSHNPIAPKKAGYNVHVLDHATAEELRVKYADHPVNLENIEEVDFVWRGEPLAELIGRERCYDWIVASHVIEHVTDFVGFLNQCEKLLAPDGVISLVVPDKRYCFDYYRWPSTTGDVLQAYTDKRIRHSPGTVFDYFADVANMEDRITWTKNDSGVIKFVHTFKYTEDFWRQALTSNEYIDAHSWRFTPSSFRIILNDLQQLGLTELAEVGGFDTAGFEFYITLGKRKQESVIYDRQQLSRNMMREIGESIKCLA
jgi:glycosyltransferase involved in cell wall biosynthesis